MEDPAWRGAGHHISGPWKRRPRQPGASAFCASYAIYLRIQEQATQSPMPNKSINFDTVRKIGLALPGVEESTMYGSPALKIRGKLLACIAINKAAEPNTLVVCVDFDRRAELLETDPRTYYLKDHY